MQSRDRVVSKDDLIASIWNGRLVSESTLTNRITAVRKAVGDRGEQQSLIRTVPPRGVRFIGTVRESTCHSDSSLGAPSHTANCSNANPEAGRLFFPQARLAQAVQMQLVHPLVPLGPKLEV